MNPRVAVIILNWNGWKDTIECLESLSRVQYPNFWVIVVDNGSQDGSVARMREYCQGRIEVKSRFFPQASKNKPVAVTEYSREEALAGGGEERFARASAPNMRLVVIRNEENLGFAEGNNIGIRCALRDLNTDFVMLLNNDTVVDPAFMAELITVADSDPRIGILGPKTFFYDYEGKDDIIVYAGARIAPWREIVYKHIGGWEPDRGQFDVDTDTEWVSGAAMMIRRNLLEKSLLNSSYNFGNEDAEYCIRARKSGHRVVYVHKSKVWHKVGVSRIKAATSIKRDTFAYFRFIKENLSWPVFIYHVFLFVALVLPRWSFADIVLRGDLRTLRAFASQIKRQLK